MTLSLSLAPETEQKLRQRAAEAGQSVERYIEQLVQRDVLGTNGEQSPTPASSPPVAVPSGRTLEELLTPIREEFERSGMTEEELAGLVEDIREEIWQEKQARKGQ
jgi:plasmid stability protein